MKNTVISIIVIAASALATAQVLPPQRIAALPDQPRHVSREDFQSHAGPHTLAGGHRPGTAGGSANCGAPSARLACSGEK
ncbi:hypothetical protein [Janthinobacterium sp. PSPC2-1]|uniref:hypothetical protein n=1 Tax=unclassified Janthinobacterium TaxID=2610881 RepID=UPI003CE89F12